MRGEPGKEARTVSQFLVESIIPGRLTVKTMAYPALLSTLPAALGTSPHVSASAAVDASGL